MRAKSGGCIPKRILIVHKYKSSSSQNRPEHLLRAILLKTNREGEPLGMIGKRRRGLEIYLLMILAYLILQVFRTGLTAIKTDLEETFFLTAVQYSNLSSAFFYSYALMQIPAGIMIDRLGPRRIASGGVLLMGISVFLCTVVTKYEFFFAARLLMGAGAGTIFLSILKLQTIWFDKGWFGTLTGITTFLGNLGGALSQAPLVLLVSVVSWRQAYSFMAIGTIVLGGMIAYCAKDAPEQERLPENQPQASASTFESFIRVIKNRTIYIPACINFIDQGIFFCIMTWAMPALIDVYQINALQAGVVTVFPPISAAVTSLAAGRATDHFRARKPVGIICQIMLCIILAIPACLLPNVEAAGAIKIAIGSTGLAAFYSIHFGTAKDLCPPECSAMAMSVVNLGTFAGASLFPVIFGKLVEHGSGADLTKAYQHGFIFLLAGSMVAVVLGCLVCETHRGSQEAETRPGCKQHSPKADDAIY